MHPRLIQNDMRKFGKPVFGILNDPTSGDRGGLIRSACVRYGSGTTLCVIEQPCPELRGALVWVPAWNVVRPAAVRGRRDTVASSSCACSCAPVYIEMRDLVVLRKRAANEWKDMTPAPTVVSVAETAIEVTGAVLLHICTTTYKSSGVWTETRTSRRDSTDMKCTLILKTSFQCMSEPCSNIRIRTKFVVIILHFAY